MSVECRSCGHVIPQGQFRCGKCGAAQTRDTFDDLNPVGEVVDEEPRSSQRSAAQNGNAPFDDEPRSAQRSLPHLVLPDVDVPEGAPRSPSSGAQTLGSQAHGTQAHFDDPPSSQRSVPYALRPALEQEPRGTQRAAPPGPSKFDDEPPRSAPRPVPDSVRQGFDEEPRTTQRAMPPQPKEESASSGREPTGENARDSLVPRGTFASDEPEPTTQSATNEIAPPAPIPEEAPVKVAVREVSEASRSTPVRSDGTPSTTAQRIRPPFLASEILHEELTPKTPGSNVLTLGLRLCGALGLAVGWVGLSSAAGAFIAVGALSLLGMSFLSLGFAARAAATLAVSGVAFAMVALWRVSIVAQSEDLILALAITTLSSALWLRAWHRGSTLARGLVGVGLFAALGWVSVSGTRDLLSLNWTMQSWLPALTWVLFVILCLLSLLAFMDKHTTGACDIWAASLLVWYGVHALAREALFNGAGLDTLTALGLGEPVFAAPFSIATAQLVARILSKARTNSSRLVRQAV